MQGENRTAGAQTAANTPPGEVELAGANHLSSPRNPSGWQARHSVLVRGLFP
jgi:hypothetical protein